jgi:hypothetical protein
LFNLIRKIKLKHSPRAGPSNWRNKPRKTWAGLGGVWVLSWMVARAGGFL